jgi:hypothetical protein
MSVPAPASARAMDLPMPLLLPVTIATLFLNETPFMPLPSFVGALAGRQFSPSHNDTSRSLKGSIAPRFGRIAKPRAPSIISGNRWQSERKRG